VYLGSIRFYKHLIIVALTLVIVIPVTFSALVGAKNINYQSTIYEMNDKLQAFEVKPGIEELNYQALYPEMITLQPEKSIYQEKTVYLTFDDGPSARTLEILDILKTYKIKATFFVTGKTDEASVNIMKEIVRQGHTIGIHTYTHKYIDIYASVSSYLEDFHNEYQLIYESTGVKPEIYRFPGGSINAYNRACYQQIIAELSRRGFVYFDWNISMQDTATRASTASIIQASITGVDQYSRVILLGHDSSEKQAGVAALPMIIEKYMEAGFAFDKLTKEDVPISFSYTE